jgi:hypothetical protein
VENTGAEGLSRLTDWLLIHMAAYYRGGVPYAIAARWTYGELRACYRRQHWHKKVDGTVVRTVLPEIPETEAAAWARRAWEEIKEAYCEKY